jgi:hypothetical protein
MDDAPTANGWFAHFVEENKYITLF